MSKSKNHSIVKPIIYCVLSFILCAVLFLLSLACIAKLTVFSKDFMLNTMASQGYYSMIKDELKTSLRSLGNASGLTDEFVDSFVETLDIRQIETDYISAFYSGEKTLVNTVTFKQQLNAALDDYIVERGLDREKVNDKNVEYLVSHATSIYVNAVSIPFFSTIGNFIFKYDTPLTIAIAVLSVAAVIIGCIIVFTNEFVHRRYRYLCYAFTGNAITLTVIPSIVFISGILPKINIATRSLYSIFVSYFSALFAEFYILAGISAVAAMILFLLFYKRYKRIAKRK